MLSAGPFAAFPDPLYHISLDLRYLISSRPHIRKMRKTQRRSRHPVHIYGPTSPNTKRQAVYQLIDGCTKPAVTLSHILWCRDDGEAEQWLRHENLPWCFLASFINYCFRVHRGHYLRGKKHGSNHKRLLARLRTHPIRDYELIRDTEYYFDHHAAHSKIKSGLVNINDLGELFLFEVYYPQ